MNARATRARVIPLNLRVNALARGARMVVFPKQPKQRQQHPAPVAPKLCAAPHPDLFSVSCKGKPAHRGKHRARMLAGLTFRWDR